jgi:hypothetical protein
LGLYIRVIVFIRGEICFLCKADLRHFNNSDLAAKLACVPSWLIQARKDSSQANPFRRFGANRH